MKYGRQNNSNSKSAKTDKKSCLLSVCVVRDQGDCFYWYE